MDYHDPYQDLVIEQEKGYRLLDGDDAMQVIRWRKNDKNSPYGNPEIGDSGRMQIQQDFLKAVLKQLLQLKNVTNIGKIAKVFQENVETDLSFENILWFGKQAVFGGLSVDDVTFTTMPWYGVYVYSRSISSAYGRPMKLDYVAPNATKLLDLVNDGLSPFVERFSMSDLDIMSVNEDGSLASSTGHVEDSKAAARPPVHVDRYTGAITAWPDSETDTGETDTGDGTETTDPAGGTGDTGTTTPESPDAPVTVPDGGDTDTATPDSPDAPITTPDASGGTDGSGTGDAGAGSVVDEMPEWLRP